MSGYLKKMILALGCLPAVYQAIGIKLHMEEPDDGDTLNFEQFSQLKIAQVFLDGNTIHRNKVGELEIAQEVKLDPADILCDGEPKIAAEVRLTPEELRDWGRGMPYSDTIHRKTSIHPGKDAVSTSGSKSSVSTTEAGRRSNRSLCGMICMACLRVASCTQTGHLRGNTGGLHHLSMMPPTLPLAYDPLSSTAASHASYAGHFGSSAFGGALREPDHEDYPWLMPEFLGEYSDDEENSDDYVQFLQTGTNVLRKTKPSQSNTLDAQGNDNNSSNEQEAEVTDGYDRSDAQRFKMFVATNNLDKVGELLESNEISAKTGLPPAETAVPGQRPPLVIAAEFGLLDMAKLLLKHCSDEDVNFSFSPQGTAVSKTMDQLFISPPTSPLDFAQTHFIDVLLSGEEHTFDFVSLGSTLSKNPRLLAVQNGLNPVWDPVRRQEANHVHHVDNINWAGVRKVKFQHRSEKLNVVPAKNVKIDVQQGQYVWYDLSKQHPKRHPVSRMVEAKTRTQWDFWQPNNHPEPSHEKFLDFWAKRGKSIHVYSFKRLTKFVRFQHLDNNII